MRRGVIMAAAAVLFAAVQAWAGEVVNLNAASVEQLQTLPGIGPGRAEAIVRYRQQHGQFATVDELDRVPGIGPALIQRLHDRVSVAAAPVAQIPGVASPVVTSDGVWRGRVE